MGKSMAKVVFYQRVSSDDQAVANQVPALEDWVKASGHEIAAVYRENESAWKNGHQKELGRLLADIRSGRRKYDVVLVWALDRLSREGTAAILNLVNTLKTYGVRVISIQEPWTEAPGEIGEVLFAIAGWVAHVESERKSGRTEAGLVRAVREGQETRPTEGQ